jgi:hypothetical protein
VYAKSLHLPGYLEPHLLHQAVVLHGAQGHLAWKAECAIEPHGKPPLQVHAQHQRGFGGGLEAVGELGLAHRTTLEEDESADVTLLHELFDLSLVLGVLVGIGGHHHELRDALIEAQRSEDRIGPRRWNIEEYRSHLAQCLVVTGCIAEGRIAIDRATEGDGRSGQDGEKRETDFHSVG